MFMSHGLDHLTPIVSLTPLIIFDQFVRKQLQQGNMYLQDMNRIKLNVIMIKFLMNSKQTSAPCLPKIVVSTPKT